jgi:polyribonucleotide nucleotidyltransferase
MNEAIDAPDEMAATAPRVISVRIPVDKIGEVIGPKGKVINSIQGETGANFSVDDDGLVGIVSIASSDMSKVDEAERQIKLILDPPTADVGAVYDGVEQATMRGPSELELRPLNEEADFL